MSALAETQPKQMESNKRQAPPDLRTQFIKKQKNMAQKWTSVDMPNAPTPAKAAQPQLTLELPDELDCNTLEISMIKRRNGEFIPKVHRKDDARKRNMPFLLPTMAVKWQNLGKEGNLNKKMGRYTVTDVNKARYTASLEPGCPAELEKLMPTLVEEQQQFMKALKTVCEGHMQLVFHHDDDSSWDKTKDGKELEDFVSDANYSCIKSVKDENDDDYEIISLARRLTDFQGNPNEPVFWKINPDGKFETIEPRYIPKGSLIQCTGTLRAYNVNSEMYGVSMDMGRDIIVVWMPPKKTKEEKEVKTTLPSVPFISFDY